MPTFAAAICPCHYRLPGQTNVAHLCNEGLPKYLPDKFWCWSMPESWRTLSLLLILPCCSCTWHSGRLLQQRSQ